MKRIFYIVGLIAILAGAFVYPPSGVTLDLHPIAFPFIGKWNPSEDPALLDDYGLQDVQNVRRIGKHFRGISGHTVINASSVSTYPYVLNGFHFVKDQPQESHVIISVASTSTSPSDSYLYKSTDAIPGTGSFSSFHTDASGGAGRGRFSTAPAGNMVYSNGAQTLIWGGSEIEPVSFIATSVALVSTQSILTSPMDYSEAVRDTIASVESMATVGTTHPVWLVGFYRPLQGVKFYISTANAQTATLSASEWTGSTWAALSITDNTAVGGKTLAKTGTVTWDSTVSSSKVRYINGLSLYWYQFELSSASASATIYYATVDAPIQTIKNIWDGALGLPAKTTFFVNASSTYKDYTDDVVDETNTTSADLSSATNADQLFVGFVGIHQGISFTMKAGSENTTVSGTSALYYWTGATWAAVTGLTDSTNIDGDHPLSRTGVMSWAPIRPGLEFTKTIGDDLPLNYYKIVFSGGLDADCKIAEIRGIPAPAILKNYSFSEQFQNRLFLFSEYQGERNKAIYSAANTPDIFNGADSGPLYFGDKTEIIAAKSLYNVFRTFAADQFIIAKKNETYRLSGDGPDNWVVSKLSSNVGCIAPLSMVSCESSDSSETEVKRQVVIWQSDKGFMLTDGAAVIPISADIRCYFDPNDSRYIPTSRQSKTVAWYDPSIKSYKALISSGSTATYHNVELEYSLVTKEWTKIYREDGSGADPLQSGFQVVDTTGVGYTYGGNTKGYVYRLENGATFAGTNITNKIQTKDLILDAQTPLFRKSTVKFLRTAHKKKSGTISISHYGDQVLTVNGSSNQVVPSAITTSATPYNTQSCNLGPFLYHSFLFTSVSSVADGMELSGLAIYSEPYTSMR